MVGTWRKREVKREGRKVVVSPRAVEEAELRVGS